MDAYLALLVWGEKSAGALAHLRDAKASAACGRNQS
jgi:hypothetical protein